MHVLDGGILKGRPWIGTERGFLSASLLNARKLPNALYSKGTAVVLSPLSRLVCGYPQDSGTKSWTRSKVATPGCGPRMCTADDVPLPPPRSGSGYPCAFPPSMLKAMLQVFEDSPVELSAYTEMVISTAAGEVRWRGSNLRGMRRPRCLQMTSPLTGADSLSDGPRDSTVVQFAIEAVVCDQLCNYFRGPNDDETHAGLLSHFGLDDRQLPLLRWGPGLKGHGPLFVDM